EVQGSNRCPPATQRGCPLASSAYELSQNSPDLSGASFAGNGGLGFCRRVARPRAGHVTFEHCAAGRTARLACNYGNHTRNQWYYGDVGWPFRRLPIVSETGIDRSAMAAGFQNHQQTQFPTSEGNRQSIVQQRALQDFRAIASIRGFASLPGMSQPHGQYREPYPPLRRVYKPIVRGARRPD